MDFGAVLSRSLSLYRRNLNLVLPHLIEYVLDLLILFIFGIFAAIGLILSLGSFDIASLMSLLSGPKPYILLTIAMIAISALFLIFLLLSSLSRAAVIGMVVEARKDGKTSLNTGIKSAKNHGLQIFGYTLIVSIVPLLLLGILTAFILLAFFLAGIEAGSSGFELIALIIFMGLFVSISYIIIYVLAMFSPQKIVILGIGPIEGITSSFGFVKKNPMPVVIYIGFWVAVMILTSIFSMILSVPGIIFSNLDQFIAVFFRILENITSMLIGLLVAPFLEAVKTIIALDSEDSIGGEVEKSPL